MDRADIPHVRSLADAVHKNYPEDEAIFAEKQRLYREGCFSLILDDAVVGYIIAHPWRRGETPAINRLLRELPQNPDTLYWHDIVLAPDVRGRGAVQQGMALVIERAKAEGFSTLSGTAVSGTVKYWEKQGFRLVSDEAHDLPNYGEEARSMVYFLTAG